LGKRKTYSGFWWGQLEETDHLKYLDMNESGTLNHITKKQDVRTRNGYGQAVGCCKLGNKVPGFLKQCFSNSGTQLSGGNFKQWHTVVWW